MVCSVRRIFGPVKDINPHDAKFKGVRSREAAVDKKGELVTKSIVRRERMGHISLAAPVAHIWFLTWHAELQLAYFLV
jgi:DNA-directed RNA polymerase subunit beta'